MPNAHPWRLVGPWYYWQRQIEAGAAANVRDTRPAFQKFDQSTFVDSFIQQPQHSLKFVDTIDQLFAVDFIDVPAAASLSKSISLFISKDSEGRLQPKQPRLVARGLRKLFLATHKRYYAVVCQLHCDLPGFPSGMSDEPCQAGFVVRRRYLKYPRWARGQAAALLREIVSIEAGIAELDQKAPLRATAARKRAVMVQRYISDGTFAERRQALLDSLDAKRRELQTWKDENGVDTVQEGWFPSAFDKVGAWRLVEDTPATLDGESTFPLFRLRGNPTVPDHDATGYAMYFGVVSASSLDTDSVGRPRFDHQSTYEVRCFVRRHQPQCPRKPLPPDCHGELVWSRPTEPFCLAAAADLVGTANRPMTIHVPNLGELAAQAATLPFGKFSPTRVVQPQSLRPKISGGAVTDGSVGGAQTCFFAIPLITIVALFVLMLFLPIVVIIFQLWFLLAFKFCIPPQFKLDAGVSAELNVVNAEVSAVSAVTADLDDAFAVDVGGRTITPGVLNADLAHLLSNEIASDEGLDQSAVRSKLAGDFANTALMQLNKNLSEEARLPSVSTASDAPLGLDLMADLEFEPRLTIRPRVT